MPRNRSSTIAPNATSVAVGEAQPEGREPKGIAPKHLSRRRAIDHPPSRRKEKKRIREDFPQAVADFLGRPIFCGPAARLSAFDGGPESVRAVGVLPLDMGPDGISGHRLSMFTGRCLIDLPEDSVVALPDPVGAITRSTRGIQCTSWTSDRLCLTM
jgi:hypothetical protein